MRNGKNGLVVGLTMINGGITGMIITCLAVASWCAFAYLLPIVAMIVWWRRRKDKTEVIQYDDVELEVGEPSDL